MPIPDQHELPAEDRQADEVPAAWQPRFGIRSLLLMMLVFSVMAAACSYLLQSERQQNRLGQLGFILFTLAAPVFLVLAFSLLRLLANWWSSR